MGIAVALGGKGGTGKTTIAGLLVRYMVNNGMKPVLAVDADSNSNLNEVLGMELDGTLGEAREQMKKDVPIGMTKDVFMEMQMEHAIAEGKGYDLIAMGRPEGPGCYCAANNILTELLDRLIRNYNYLVVDNEAGMEHFSRLTQKNIDLLLLVSDPSRRGLTAACRIVDLVNDLPIRVGKIFLVVNMLQNPPGSWPEDVIRTFGEDNIAVLPADPMLAQFDMEGRPTVELPEDAPIMQATSTLFESLLAEVVS